MKITRVHVGAGVLALAASLVVAWEGYRPQPYQDVIGVLTVCYGHSHATPGKTYSRAECDALMQGDLAEADAMVQRCIPQPIPPQIEAALVDATYNIGPRVVCGSSIQRKARAGDWRGVCDGLLAWKYSGGRVVQGLLNRRKAERNLCLEGL